MKSTYMAMVPQRHGQTDGQLAVAIPRNAHVAFCGKKIKEDRQKEMYRGRSDKHGYERVTSKGLHT